MKPLPPLLQKIGLHPLVAFAMISVDMMLFAGDTTLGPVGWLLSTLIASLLSIPCLLLQRFAYRDGWLVAAAKAVIVGVITAIPTAMPALLTAAGGLLGAIGLLKTANEPGQKEGAGDESRH